MPRRCRRFHQRLVGTVPRLRSADVLTVARFALAAPLTAVLWRGAPNSSRLAFWLLLAGSLTDLLDGQVARASGATSALGAALDPLADKALVDGALLALARDGRVPAALAALIAGRDLLVTIGRVRRTVPLAPSPAARAKTALLYLSLGLILATLDGPRAARRVALAGLWLAAILSTASALTYLWPSRPR
jgi:cardiolipin synthase (CMP-forming)